MVFPSQICLLCQSHPPTRLTIVLLDLSAILCRPPHLHAFTTRLSVDLTRLCVDLMWPLVDLNRLPVPSYLRRCCCFFGFYCMLFDLFSCAYVVLSSDGNFYNWSSFLLFDGFLLQCFSFDSFFLVVIANFKQVDFLISLL